MPVRQHPTSQTFALRPEKRNYTAEIPTSGISHRKREYNEQLFAELSAFSLSFPDMLSPDSEGPAT